MRIGILTFHRAVNYGAFLQAFALKRHLETLGHQVEIVDYWPEGHADGYRLFPHSWKNRPFKGKIKFLVSLALRYTRAKKRIDKMRELVKRHFNQDEEVRYQRAEALRELTYDCVVYGSDQIWWKSTIPGYSGFDPAYWGEYVPETVKKVAYAPSMGIIDLTDADKEQIRKWLCNFDALSVRETGLYEAIRCLTDKEISVVLDPVFLLSKEEWSQYCRPVKRAKYILYYNLIASKEADALVERLEKEWRYDVVEVNGAVRPMKIGKRYVQTADAIDFISLIRNAELVVTSSFHGTAFSLIFEKQFYAIGMGKRSGRVESLLQRLGIVDRLIKDIVHLPNSNIDYFKLASLLDSQVLHSKKFLSYALNGG